MDLHLLVTVLKDTLDAKSEMIILLKESNALKDQIIEAKSSQIKVIYRHRKMKIVQRKIKVFGKKQIIKQVANQGTKVQPWSAVL